MKQPYVILFYISLPPKKHFATNNMILLLAHSGTSLAVLLYPVFPGYTNTVTISTTIGTEARSTNQYGVRDQRSSPRIRVRRTECSGVRFHCWRTGTGCRVWFPGCRNKYR